MSELDLGVRAPLRDVRVDDRTGILALFDRCTPESRYARFLSPVPVFPAGHLDALVGPSPGVQAVVATWPGPASDLLIGLASIHPSGPGRVELAALVEDGWQRRGIGSRMVALLVDRARRQGIKTVSATVLTEHRHVFRMLRRVIGPGRLELDGWTTEVTMALTAPIGGTITA